MPKRGERVIEVRVVEGRMKKRCTGCGEWKDAETEFWWRFAKVIDALPYQLDPRPQCKSCEGGEANTRHSPHLGQHGYVRWDRISTIVEAAIARIGQSEYSRRTGISLTSLWLLRKGKRTRVTKVNAACMLHIAREVFQSGEVRTREEIWYGNRSRVHEPSDSGPATVPESEG